ncbi:hypothetical protein KAU33_05380, partial [Candidatus Dependentiae bacterium]|nr:hypothetical protein [Candidatus Dependentiae bacterium]
INIIFRDHKLSDNFAFNYHQIPVDIAINNFMKYLEKVYNKLPESDYDYAVPIIMDGENAWEYFQNNGYEFLTGIFNRLQKDKRYTLKTVTEYMNLPQEKGRLQHLTSGSWINNNFYIWIGHNEDKKAWELLGEVRNDLTHALEKEGNNYSDFHKHLAWKSLYIAEGSDWTWWYGEDQSTANDQDFDELFRTHLANVYRFLGKEVPSKLWQPISDSFKHVQTLESVGLINPQIDGIDTDYYEWLEAGYLDVRHTGGTMHRAETLISYIYFGFDLENIFLRVDTKAELKDININSCRLEVVFLSPEKTKLNINCENLKGEPFDYSILKKNGDKFVEVGKVEKGAAAKEIIEIKIPFEKINVSPNDNVTFFVLLWDNGNMIERAPERGPINIVIPTKDFEQKHWTV